MLNCWESVIETLRTMQFKLSESKCVDAKSDGDGQCRAKTKQTLRLGTSGTTKKLLIL